MVKQTLSIGLDIGNTFTRYVVLKEGFIKPVLKGKIPTLLDGEKPRFLENLRLFWDKLSTQIIENNGNSPNVGIGLPFPVSKNKEKFFTFGSLRKWDSSNLGEDLENLFNCALVIDSGVNMAVWSEIIDGVGKSVKNFLYINLGTFIGVGIVINGSPYKGLNGISGELILSDLEIESYSEDLCFQSSKTDYHQSLNTRNRTIKVSSFIVALSCFLDPEVIILGGGRYNDIDAVLRSIDLHYEKLICQNRILIKPSIIIPKHKQFAGAFGAALISQDNKTLLE